MLHDRAKIVPLFPLYGGRLTSKDIQAELSKAPSAAHQWFKDLQALRLIAKDDVGGRRRRGAAVFPDDAFGC
jgi:hypothetical protein